MIVCRQGLGWISGYLLTVLLLTAAGSALAAPPRRDLVQVLSGYSAGSLQIPVNKSAMLRLPGPIGEATVAKPEIADVLPLSADTLYVLGESLGTTNLTIKDSQGRVMAVVDIAVTQDIDGIKEKLFELLPGERIEVRAAGPSVILSGQVSSPDKVTRAVSVAEQFAPGKVSNLIGVGGSQQVMLSVRFAEVQRSTAKEIGLSAVISGGSNPNVTFLTGSGPSADAFVIGALTLLDGTFALGLLFDALEEKGLIRTLAEPNLIALSGDTASFLAGGEFPIPVAQNANADRVAITVEFKEFGVALSFTPTVIGQDLINLVVKTEVSAIDTTVPVIIEDIRIPGLSVRRANTTVELRDGQSFAIAGLLQDDFRDAISQFPILGDIPILGALFRSTSFQHDQTELVVIITPRLVKPVQPAALMSPNDLSRLPSEGGLFLFGLTEGTVPPAPVRAGGLDGPTGYILP